MAQAQPEQRRPAQQLFDLGDAGGVLRRVAGAVGQHYAVGVPGEDRLRRGVGGRHRHLAAPGLELPDDVALGAVVDERHPADLFALRGIDLYGLRRGLRHAAGDGVALQGGEILGDMIGDHGVHHAALPDALGDGAGVHAADARHALLFQERVQGGLAAEVAGLAAPLAHHIALHPAVALEVLLDDAVVADGREGLQHDLAVVAGVGERLDVAHHAGVEHQLAHAGDGRAEALALVHRAVL